MFTNKAYLYLFDSDNTRMQDSLAVRSITIETSEKSLWLNTNYSLCIVTNAVLHVRNVIQKTLIIHDGAFIIYSSKT